MINAITKGKELFATHKNFILYAVIGVSGVAIDFIAFLILFNLMGIDKNSATIISTSLGITNNFIWNTLLNFKTKDRIVQRFLTFFSVGIFGLLLTLVIFYIFVDLLKINANIVKAGSIVIVVLTQYNLNKRFSFKTF